MSINDINNAAAAMNQLKARYEGFLNDADAQIAVRQAAYDNLSGDLKGIIRTELTKELYVDNTVAVPSGSSYQTLAQALGALPRGSFAIIRLRTGQVHEINSHINVGGITVDIGYYGPIADGKPIIKHNAGVDGGSNVMWGYTGHSCSVTINGCDIELPTEKADPNLTWLNSRRSVFSGARGRERFAGFQTCTVTGGMADVNLGLITVYESGYASVGLFVVTLDGPISLIVSAPSGAFSVRKTAFTLANGATETDGGTLGTNYLSN